MPQQKMSRAVASANLRHWRKITHSLCSECGETAENRLSNPTQGHYLPDTACADMAKGCTASRSPIALRIASKLLSAGLPFGDSVR